MKRGVALLVSPLVALCLLLFAASARADPSEDAQLLFETGKVLADKGLWAEACRKFERSLALEDKIGTHYRLAECWERVGKTASAWRAWRAVQAKAIAQGSEERVRYARSRALALRPRLTWVRLTFASRTDGLRVHRNGELVPASDVEKAEMVDPGRIAVMVSAIGRLPWSDTIAATEQGRTYDVRVPDLLGTGVSPKPRMTESSPSLARAGALLAAFGGIGISTSLWPLGIGAKENDPTAMHWGAGILIGSTVMASTGIAFAVIGGKKIPAPEVPGVAVVPVPGGAAAVVGGRF